MLGAGVVYGLAAVAHGSGFLAVFVAGIVIGDAEIPQHGSRCATSTSALADLGELAVFVALGLTVDLGYILSGALWWEGLVLAVILGFVVRPLVVTPLLLPSRLSHGERLFVTWAGLKGAVPILLASLAVVAAHGPGRTRSTGSSSSSCCSRSSSRARSCRASPSGSACR